MTNDSYFFIFSNNYSSHVIGSTDNRVTAYTMEFLLSIKSTIPQHLILLQNIFY